MHLHRGTRGRKLIASGVSPWNLRKRRTNHTLQVSLRGADFDGFSTVSKTVVFEFGGYRYYDSLSWIITHPISKLNAGRKRFSISTRMRLALAPSTTRLNLYLLPLSGFRGLSAVFARPSCGHRRSGVSPLRTLLIATTLVAVVLGLAAYAART